VIHAVVTKHGTGLSVQVPTLSGEHGDRPRYEADCASADVDSKGEHGQCMQQLTGGFRGRSHLNLGAKHPGKRYFSRATVSSA